MSSSFSRHLLSGSDDLPVVFLLPYLPLRLEADLLQFGGQDHAGLSYLLLMLNFFFYSRSALSASPAWSWFTGMGGG